MLRYNLPPVVLLMRDLGIGPDLRRPRGSGPQAYQQKASHQTAFTFYFSRMIDAYETIRLSCRALLIIVLVRPNLYSAGPQGLSFSDAKDLREIRPGSPPTGAPNAGGVGQNRRLSTNNRLYLENGTRQTHDFY